MNETKKTIDKKKLVFYIIGIIILIFMVICFMIAFKNYNSNSSSKTTNSNTNSENSNNISRSTITKGGNYNITGDNSCIVINTTDSVELSLNNATITCENGPAINVESAGKLSITLTGENKIVATTTEELDAAIYSKDDLILSGTGSLSLTSNYDGIVSKDDLVINGGTYTINSEDDGIKGRDSVQITDGTFNITTGGDGINQPMTKIKKKDISLFQEGHT